METWHYSPSAATVPQLVLDPYRFPGAAGAEFLTCDAPPQERTHREQQIETNGPPLLDTTVPQADASSSVPCPASSLTAWDRRRLDLQAALTSVGIPPRAGDMVAIRALSALGDAVNSALVRWITAGR
ncbi:hypothetical protein ACFW2T_30905 [Streptomyces sp. NPDC058892]|uniref:hypothetical protein n=1 Tax=unclassified Streptomyces TaxID=2593676 RepID=UPI000445250F|nr:hypothetical protein [Streptomyces sp. PCS3-D2]WKV70104.1 hypothetical protein AW27_000390 [Streptomyces sp. PCS3-D2]